MLSRLVLIVIVSEGANSRLPAARDRPAKGRQRTWPLIILSKARHHHPETVAVDGLVIRHIGFSDLLDALRLGWEDFKAVPSHAIVLCVIYPIIGILLWRMVLGYSVLPMLVPIAAGFALIGPFAALGLYELSYRRELGQEASAWHAFGVLRAPSFGSMLGLGALLFAIFVAWVVTAHAIYVSTFGNTPAAAIPDFFTQVFTTSEGWRMIMIGVGVGFLFAAVALCISIVSFPLMLHQHADMSDAMLTSMRMVAKNPIAAAEWGLIVAVLLMLGSIPVLPRPHDRHAVARSCDVAPLSQGDREPVDVVSTRSPEQMEREKRYAADFPSVLLPPYGRKHRFFDSSD